MDLLEKNNRSNSQNKKGFFTIEKRKHPRFLVDLPLNYSRVGDTGIYGGMIANISEGGFLAFIHQRLEIGDLLRIEIIYLREFEVETIRAVAKIVWSDLSSLKNSEEGRYGLQFLSIDEKDLLRLKNYLKDISTVRLKF